MRKIFIVLFLATLIVLGISGSVFWQNQQKIAAINTFDDCAAAGYEIMESYPARCMTPDKRSFTQEITDEEKRRIAPPYTTPRTGFVCGNRVCEDITCDAIGCPDAETPSTCPQDCFYDGHQDAIRE